MRRTERKKKKKGKKPQKGRGSIPGAYLGWHAFYLLAQVDAMSINLNLNHVKVEEDMVVSTIVH